MKRTLALGIVVAIFASVPSAFAVTPKAGGTCSKAGATSAYAGKKYTCVKSGKKLVWNKGVTVPVPKPVATPTPTANPFAAAAAAARDKTAAEAATAAAAARDKTAAEAAAVAARDKTAAAAAAVAARDKTAAAAAAAAAAVAARDKAIADKAEGITCPGNGKCEIGNIGPGGGIVFYVAPAPQSWGQYLEVAPATWNGRSTDPTAPWCDVTDVSLVSKVTDPKLKRLIGDEIGKGSGNTQLMTAYCKSGAANLASAYRGGGKSDWFLPSKDELNQLCQYARGQAQSAARCDVTGTLKVGFATDLYWSSSEGFASFAWSQYFYGGYQNYDNKNFPGYVRPVRAFS